jgi:hypothetical protein
MELRIAQIRRDRMSTWPVWTSRRCCRYRAAIARSCQKKGNSVIVRRLHRLKACATSIRRGGRLSGGPDFPVDNRQERPAYFLSII